MGESVKVIVRCRPMNSREKGLNCKEIVNIDSRTALCAITNPNEKKVEPKSFTFDGAYDTNSTTEQIYADIGFPLVEGVTEGYNGTIFAYGQTGCGKSFSMQGISDPPTQRGIIPRAFDHIFETIQVSDGIKYLVHASYLEIYNEEIRDLLGKDIKQRLELKEHPDRGVYVQSLSMHPCKNVTDCERVMEKGWKNRSTGATLMNADSSRSHSIFSIHLERCEMGDDDEEHIRAAKLNLVDLAGSERQAKTGSTGDRLKEATKINLSLSALGNVISALVDGKSKHIPYRDSKLTRLLQDSLGGNTKTLMVACLSPADNNYEETLSTLRYANRAKNIKNKPKINEDPKDAMLREYQEEIARLKAMLRGDMPVQLAAADGENNNKKELEAAKQRIREEYEAELHSMKDELIAVRASKEEVEEEVEKLRNHYEKKMSKLEKSTSQPIDQVESGEENLQDDDNILDEVSPTSGKQRAVHLATRKDGGNGKQRKQLENSEADVEKANRRLQELQHFMVGGEQRNNEVVKERRNKKKRYAEDRRKKLQEALSHMDGDELMVEIYENTQDELRSKSKQLEKQKQKCESLKREILDLQSEFEFDRIDYLDTIRKQSQEVSYLQALVDKIHPALRRDCNYTNLDKIRSQSEWDELNERWILPKIVIERNHLPPANNGTATNGRVEGSGSKLSRETYEDLRSEERYIQKLQYSEDQQIANNYFKNTRQEELRNFAISSPLGSVVNSPLSSKSTRSISSSDADSENARKPTRLESLSNTSNRNGRKKGRGTKNEQWEYD